MINEIYLRRKTKIVVKIKQNKNSKKFLATMLKNIEPFGYTLSKEIFNILKTYSVSELDIFYKNLVKTLKDMLGAKFVHKPMYPNFPTQVMEMGEAELYINAIIHYITLETPEYEKDTRPKLKDKIKLKVINLGSKEDFLQIFKNLLDSKVAISPTDRKDIVWFIKQYRDDVLNYLPEKIENKENLSYFLGVLKENDLVSNNVLSKYFKTATDVLRFITAMSEGDVSLASNTKFKNLKRSDRKLILNILELCGNPAEDMVRYQNKWIRLGEILHPFDYRKLFPKTCDAFDKIRNNKKIETFNSKTELYFKNKEYEKLVDLLKKRPGEFARKLDWILRKFPEHTYILDRFEKITDKISTTVLLQVSNHFKNRNSYAHRVFFPKGSVAKAQLIKNDLSSIFESSCNKVVKYCDSALIKKFSDKEPLGNVYIEDKLKNCIVPFALRSASKSFRTITRGSKIEMDKGKVVRLFVHWKNIGKGFKYSDDYYDSRRVDIDLSATIYDKDWNYKEHVSWTNLRSGESCHSGDITNAPNGASEFIDLKIQSILDRGGRFIVMSLNSFTGQKFGEIPECFAGAMMREKSKSGEIYEPATVKDKFDITSKATMCVPLIFDLEEQVLIWCDMVIGTSHSFGRIETKQTGMTAVGMALTNLPKPNLYDLFKLHGEARGKIVKTKKSAKTIFSIEEGITPFDIEKITSEYL